MALNLGRWTRPYAHVLDRDSYRYEDRQPHESPESEAAPPKARNPEEAARESTVISSTKKLRTTRLKCRHELVCMVRHPASAQIQSDDSADPAEAEAVRGV